MPAARPLVDRFWEKVNRDGPVIRPDLGPCWIWTGALDARGYGRINAGADRGGRSKPAHAISLELATGKRLEPGAVVCHRCDHLPCVRPEHLFAGDQADNLADMVAKNRQARGAAKPNSRLTENDVIDIRSLFAFGARMAVLAKEFGVHLVTIFDVVNYRTWRHV